MPIVTPTSGGAVPDVSTIASVNTFADVRLLGAGVFPVIEVLGGTTVGDGQDGVFYWKSTSVAADDGFAVLAPSVGGTGRWIRIYGSVIQSGTGAVSETVQAALRRAVFVEQYGAVGDGVTDCSAAFTLAKNAAGTGGTIFIGNGTFILNDWTPTTQVRIVGNGAGDSSVGGTILKAKAGATYVMVLSAHDYSTIECVLFDGNATASSGLKITTDGASTIQGTLLESVQFNNCLVGCKIDDGGAIDQADKTMFHRCRWSNNTTGLWIVSPNAQDTLIVGGSFDSHTTAIRLTSGGLKWISGAIQTATTGVLMDGGSIVGLSLEDVFTEAVSVDIDGNAAWPNGAHGLGVELNRCFLQGTSVAVKMGQVASKLRAVQCYFENNINCTTTDCDFRDEYSIFGTGAWNPSGGATNYRVKVSTGALEIYGGTTKWWGINANTGTVTNAGLLDATGGQVKFPAAQSASSDVNTLDDYEEGSWTPAIGGTATYTARTGTYIKVGRKVTVRGDITINLLGSGSTSAISGLPFTSANNGVSSTVKVAFWAALAVAPVFLAGYILSNGTSITFTGLTAASANITDAIAIFGNNARVVFSATYEASA